MHPILRLRGHAALKILAGNAFLARRSCQLSSWNSGIYAVQRSSHMLVKTEVSRVCVPSAAATCWRGPRS
eukprot:1159202-Pelagomonas_calceolata.AAC.10